MSQSIATLVGASAGAVLSLGFRGHLDSGLFVAVVASTFFALGLRAIVTADIELAGRGRSPPTVFVGLSARLIGALIAAVAGGILVVVLQAP